VCGTNREGPGAVMLLEKERFNITDIRFWGVPLAVYVTDC